MSSRLFSLAEVAERQMLALELREEITSLQPSVGTLVRVLAGTIAIAEDVAEARERVLGAIRNLELERN